MELAFVLARRQNYFFVEIVDAIRNELNELGIGSSVHLDGFPQEVDDRVYVLVPPHEWFALDGRRHRPTRRQLLKTVFICAEQPGTSFFDDDILLAPLAGGVLDVNHRSVDEFARRGVYGVEHFPLGWTRAWRRVPVGEDGEPDLLAEDRDLDALHLGIYSPRRAEALAAAGEPLSRWRSHFVLSDDDRPNSELRANFAIDEVKWSLLRRAKVLLNIHVSDRPYFEWQRIVQAVCNGCAIVSEHSVGIEPLVVPHHLLVGRSEVLGWLARGLLEDDERRQQIARDAYVFLRDELPFRRSVERLTDVAAGVIEGRRRHTTAHWVEPPDEEALPELISPPAPPLQRTPTKTRYPPVTEDRDSAALRAGLKDVRLELLAIRREIARLEGDLGAGRPVPAVEVVSESRAWRDKGTRVSVIVPLYNHERHIVAALWSIAQSRYSDVEVIVVDDGSTDGSLTAVRHFLAQHEGLPMLVIRHPINRGLAHARNTAIDFARGEFAFMLDADNEIYVNAIRRLVEAADADDGAAFAYGMLAMFSDSGPSGLRSQYPWQPERLRTGNYIDAMALWRLSALRRLGGYGTDPRLHGWEDYDLWCRAAEADHRGAFVPEVVARYRVSMHSMLSITNLSAQTVVSLIIERSPRLFAGVEPPL